MRLIYAQSNQDETETHDAIIQQFLLPQIKVAKQELKKKDYPMATGTVFGILLFLHKQEDLINDNAFYNQDWKAFSAFFKDFSDIWS